MSGIASSRDVVNSTCVGDTTTAGRLIITTYATEMLAADGPSGCGLCNLS